MEKKRSLLIKKSCSSLGSKPEEKNLNFFVSSFSPF